MLHSLINGLLHLVSTVMPDNREIYTITIYNMFTNAANYSKGITTWLHVNVSLYVHNLTLYNIYCRTTVSTVLKQSCESYECRTNVPKYRTTAVGLLGLNVDILNWRNFLYIEGRTRSSVKSAYKYNLIYFKKKSESKIRIWIKNEPHAAKIFTGTKCTFTLTQLLIWIKNVIQNMTINDR